MILKQWHYQFSIVVMAITLPRLNSFHIYYKHHPKYFSRSNTKFWSLSRNIFDPLPFLRGKEKQVASLDTSLEKFNNNKDQIKIMIYPDTYFVVENYDDFIQKDPKVPPMQREFVEERVQEFYETIMSHYDTYTRKLGTTSPIQEVTPYLGLLSVGYYGYKYQLLDGQHRFRAYKRFAEQTLENKFKIFYILKEFPSDNDMTIYYKNINNNFQMPESVIDDIFSQSRPQIIQYLKVQYGDHISSSNKPLFPNIHIDTFLDQFCYTRLPNSNATTIINFIESENTRIGEYLKIHEPTLYDKAKRKQEFYLAYVLSKKKNSSSSKREKIPAGVRKHLWKLKSLDGEKGACYCCQKALTFDTFIAGHNIAVANGGANHLYNLELLCNDCNSSMGTMSISEYKSKYYSHLNK